MNKITDQLRGTPSRSKRKLLDEAADRIEELEKDKAALIETITDLATGNDPCLHCAHCCIDGKPAYRPDEKYMEYCKICDEYFSCFEWKGRNH